MHVLRVLPIFIRLLLLLPMLPMLLVPMLMLMLLMQLRLQLLWGVALVGAVQVWVPIGLCGTDSQVCCAGAAARQLRAHAVHAVGQQVCWALLHSMRLLMLLVVEMGGELLRSCLTLMLVLVQIVVQMHSRTAGCLQWRWPGSCGDTDSCQLGLYHALCIEDMAQPCPSLADSLLTSVRIRISHCYTIPPGEGVLLTTLAHL